MLYRPPLEFPTERAIRYDELPIPDFEVNPLFLALQLEQDRFGHVYPDSKTAADIPFSNAAINLYLRQRDMPNFSLRHFAEHNLRTPGMNMSDYTAQPGTDIETHISEMWDTLKFDGRGAAPNIELDYPDVIPGQRFIEIYYWDALQTVQGLLAQGRFQQAKHIVDNRVRLVAQLGHVPNSTKTYNCRRSQPPVLSRMVNELVQHTGNENLLVEYLPSLIAEHDYWMETSRDDNAVVSLNVAPKPDLRVVYMPDGSMLNRYYGDGDTPRPEGWREDIKTAEEAVAHGDVPDSEVGRRQVYREIRAAAESGHDFSERWMADEANLRTVQTTNIVPVDLNCLLLNLERTIERGCGLLGDKKLAWYYRQTGSQRQQAIQKYCYKEDGDGGYVYDYNIATGAVTPTESLAAAYALREQVLTRNQALKVAERMKKWFLKIGGFATTLTDSDQQWSGDRGWAPLHNEAYEGLMAYSVHQKDIFSEVATVGIARWFNRLQQVFNQYRKLTEKVNVGSTMHGDLVGNGGEYPPQFGFGMTNGLGATVIRNLRNRGIAIPDGKTDTVTV